MTNSPVSSSSWSTKYLASARGRRSFSSLDGSTISSGESACRCSDSGLSAALAFLADELHRFREGLGPRNPSPDQALLEIIRQQSLELVVRERELAAAREDAKLLRSALHKAEAEKHFLEKQVAESSLLQIELNTLDVLRKEFNGLQRHIDSRVDELERKVVDIAAPVKPPSSAERALLAPRKSTSSSLPTPRVQEPRAHRPSRTCSTCCKEGDGWTPRPDASGRSSHPLDHPDDCKCSFACLQWGESTSGARNPGSCSASHPPPDSQPASCVCYTCTYPSALGNRKKPAPSFFWLRHLGSVDQLPPVKLAVWGRPGSRLTYESFHHSPQSQSDGLESGYRYLDPTSGPFHLCADTRRTLAQ